MSDEPPDANQQVVPRPRSSAGRAGRSIPGPSRRGTTTMTDTQTTKTLPKAWQPAELEARVAARWEAADVFAPDGAGATANPGAEPFTIIQPPPNVTGSLHLDHAQRAAVEDLM